MAATRVTERKLLAKVLLDILSLLERVLGSTSNREQVGESQEDGVWHGALAGLANSERNRSDVLDASTEGGKDVVVADGEHLSREDVATLVDVFHHETILERLHAQLLEESSLTGVTLLALLEHMLVVQDFNETLGNLGRDGQRLEEIGHGGLECSHTLGDDDITLIDRRRHLVLLNAFAHLRRVLVGEDEAHIELQAIADGFKSGVLLFELTDHTAHLCVLTTVDDSVTTEVLADLVQLVGSDIVNP